MCSEPSISAVEQVVVDRARRRRVGEPGDDQRVIALDRDLALREDPLLVGDDAATT